MIGRQKMAKVAFSEEKLREVEKIKEKYPVERSAVMAVLYLAQEEFGYVNDDVIEYVADLLKLAPTRVEEVATFYTMYNKKPVGKYHIQVCHNLTCTLMGAETIVEHIEKKLGITVGETTKDGLFTLSEVECLGACGTAPVMQVNETYYEQLTPEKVDQILEELKKKSS